MKMICWLLLLVSDLQWAHPCVLFWKRRSSDDLSRTKFLPDKLILCAWDTHCQHAVIWYTPQTPSVRNDHISKKQHKCLKHQISKLSCIFIALIRRVRATTQCEPSISGCTHKFNMASRQALAPKLYKRFLQVCEQWPVDQNRLGRDLGEHLKGNLVPRIKNSQIDVSS